MSDSVLPATIPGSPITYRIEQFWCDRIGLTLSGWIISRTAPVLRLRFAAGDESYDIRRLAPRPDLVPHYPDVPNVLESGFHVFLPWRPGSAVTIEVEIEAGSWHDTVDLPRHVVPGLRAYSISDGNAPGPAPPPDAGHDALFRFVDEVNERGLVVAEVGARAVSANFVGMRRWFRDGAHYVGVDIHHGPNVDIAADAHALTSVFDAGSLGAVFSLSVMEHLAAPWMFAFQVNRALQPGGITFHSTHQTWPMHEEPNDFWRFSDAGLALLFGPDMGFEIVLAGMGSKVAVHRAFPRPEDAWMPLVSAYGASFILARKVRDIPADAAAWPVGSARSAERAGLYPRRD